MIIILCLFGFYVGWNISGYILEKQTMSRVIILRQTNGELSKTIRELR